MTVLWVDNDGPRGFLNEAGVLRKNTLEIRWADSIDAAAELLRTETFEALILDQNLPDAVVGIPRELLVWSGCRLLYWLRQTPPEQPRPWLALGEVEEWHLAPPHPDNQGLPVVLVTAFYDNEVLNAARLASPQDWQLKLLAKPVDVEELLAWLQRATGRSGRV